MLVGLAYLPDITSQFADLLGLGRCRTATHSILFAVLASSLLSTVVARLAGIRLLAAWGLTTFSVLTHVLLDLFQDSDCSPFWPFTTHRFAWPNWLPVEGVGHEALWLGGVCAVLILARALRGWKRSRPPVLRRHDQGPLFLSYGLTGLILTLAVVTHYLCSVRERQLMQARALIQGGRPAEALPLLDHAARWPHEGLQGGVEYARGEAYEGIGDQHRAEQCYLAALRERPDDFWILSDLAVLYASFPESANQRHRRVAPLLARLREHHSNRPELPRIVAKIERRLGLSQTQPVCASP